MANYRVHEGEFELPDGLVDQSVNVFTTQSVGRSDFNIVVSREPVTEGQDLGRHVDRQLELLSRTLHGFKLLGRSSVELDARPAELAVLSWQQQGNRMAQRQVYAIFGTMALTVTATCADEFPPERTAQFGALIKSFRSRT